MYLSLFNILNILLSLNEVICIYGWMYVCMDVLSSSSSISCPMYLPCINNKDNDDDDMYHYVCILRHQPPPPQPLHPT